LNPRRFFLQISIEDEQSVENHYRIYHLKAEHLDLI
jgi:hypothetical protein